MGEVMHEAPLVLLEVFVKGCEPDRPEGLAVAVAPVTQNLVVQVALTEERFRTFGWERPCSFQIPPDDAVRLAHDLLRVYAPDLADSLERAAQRAQLQLVQGGASGPEAA